MSARHPTPQPLRWRSAFTLMEVLIVVAIIAILAAIAVPNFLEAQTRTKVARVWQDLFVLADGLDQYRLDQGDFPPGLSASSGPPVASSGPRSPGGPASPAEFWLGLASTSALSRLTTPVAYLARLPIDPFLPDLSYSLAGKEEPSPASYFYWRLEGPAAASLPGVQAVLLSAGPDRAVNSAITSQTVTLLFYDASNGTKSAGDLILTMPRPAEHAGAPGEED